MFTILVTYAIASLSALLVLAVMILKIGQIMGNCPETGDTAKSAAISIATGYGAIGAGGVLLIGSVLPLLADEAGLALIPALGLAVICLGLGFSQAITTLRAVVGGARPKRPEPTTPEPTTPEPTTLEPTLA